MVDAAIGMRRIQTTCLVTLTVIATGVALFLLKPVLVPFVLALFLTYSLLPVIDLLQRYARMPYLAATTVTAVLGLGLIALLALMIYGSAAQMIANVGQYEQVIRGWITTGEQWLRDILDWMAGIMKGFGMKTPTGWDHAQSGTGLAELDLTAAATQAEQSAASPFAWNDFTSIVSNPGQKFSSIISSTLGGLMTLISNGFIVAIFVLFLLIGRATSSTASVSTAWGRVEQSVKHYIVLKVVISACTGGFQGLTLWFLGVDFAPVFGVLGFLLNFIPNIGPVLATILPLPVLPLQPDMTITVGILAIAVPGLIHFVSGNIVEPRLMGDSLDLHPIVVLLTLIFFGMIWGIVGMFLATPITAVIKILLEQSDFTRPAAHVLAGRLSALGAPATETHTYTSGHPPPDATQPSETVSGRDAEVGVKQVRRPGGAADASRE